MRFSIATKYTCTTWGQEHDDWPAIRFDAHAYYHDLIDEEKETIAELSPDFCIIRYADQTDRFIRGVLFQKVNGSCANLDYGVWVSVSEQSYNDYRDNFDNNEHEARYFGYLCNWLPGYESTLSLHTDVILSKGGNRLQVIPHEANHAFVRDYCDGIAIEEVERRIAAAIGG